MSNIPRIPEVDNDDSQTVIDVMNRVTRSINAAASGIESTRARVDELEQMVVGGLGGTTAGARARSPVDTFLADSRFHAMQKGAPTTGRVALEGVGIGQLRAATLVGDQGENRYPVQPQRQGGLFGPAARPISLLDLMPRIPVTSNTFEYVTVGTAYTNAAGYQLSEGALKPEASVPLERITAPITTIAVWLRASAQLLDDTPALRQQLTQLLTTGLLERLESEIIAGAGGAGRIDGLLNQATDIVATDSTPEVRLGEAISSLSGAGWSPNAAIVHPLDWFAMRSARTTEGLFVAGSWAEPAAPSVWNVPVVVSSSMPRGQALVADLSQTALLDRMQPVAMASREDAGNFTSNLVTLLTELRAGLAVFAPTAVIRLGLSGA